jgi:dihydrofolate reductase (trimethoprim resistance protein)
MEHSSVAVGASHNHQIQLPLPTTFGLGERVRKKSGAAWQGCIVGWYSTKLTPEGYAVESEAHIQARCRFTRSQHLSAWPDLSIDRPSPSKPVPACHLKCWISWQAPQEGSLPA